MDRHEAGALTNLKAWTPSFAREASHCGGKMKKVSTMSTGEQVPRSGTYTVFHTHPIRDIKLLRNWIFPACPKCSSAMQFALAAAIPNESALERFRLLMQEQSPARLDRTRVVDRAV